MTERELIKYCFFYKGEVALPPQYNQKDEAQLWQAEKVVCEDMRYLIDAHNPSYSMANLIAAYVGKWNPYSFAKVMDVYFKHVPNLKNNIMAIYS